MFININKPKGYTSFDVVAIVRKLSGVRKVGHAGTLDPLATGVLLVAISREFTKQISTIVEKEKEYVASVTLGKTSTTDDEEGEKTETTTKYQIPSEKQVSEVLADFVGNIQQTPPIYSAIKIKGKEAYKYARKGQEVKMQPREVLIKDIEIISYDFPILKIKVTTGPGVYIRSLARDVGEKLKTGGYMSDLVRTRIGSYRLEDSVDVDDLGKYLQSLNNSQVV